MLQIAQVVSVAAGRHSYLKTGYSIIIHNKFIFFQPFPTSPERCYKFMQDIKCHTLFIGGVYGHRCASCFHRPRMWWRAHYRLLVVPDGKRREILQRCYLPPHHQGALDRLVKEFVQLDNLKFLQLWRGIFGWVGVGGWVFFFSLSPFNL